MKLHAWNAIALLATLTALLSAYAACGGLGVLFTLAGGFFGAGWYALHRAEAKAERVTLQAQRLGNFMRERQP